MSKPCFTLSSMWHHVVSSYISRDLMYYLCATATECEQPGGLPAYQQQYLQTILHLSFAQYKLQGSL